MTTPTSASLASPHLIWVLAAFRDWVPAVLSPPARLQKVHLFRGVQLQTNTKPRLLHLSLKMNPTSFLKGLFSFPPLGTQPHPTLSPVSTSMKQHRRNPCSGNCISLDFLTSLNHSCSFLSSLPEPTALPLLQRPGSQGCAVSRSSLFDYHHKLLLLLLPVPMPLPLPLQQVLFYTFLPCCRGELDVAPMQLNLNTPDGPVYPVIVPITFILKGKLYEKSVKKYHHPGIVVIA